MSTTEQHAAIMATPSFLNRATAEYEFGQARATAPTDLGIEHDEGTPAWIAPQSDLAGCMNRHPAGRDLPTWERVTRAEQVQALWTPSGLHLAWWVGNNVTTVMLDEQGQQALRDALGVGR